jgi:hypothetical protein
MSWTRQQISRADAIRIISRAREAVCEPTLLRDLMDDWEAPTVFDALLGQYAGVGNGFLSQLCEAITGLRLEVTGDPETRLPCPCCQRRTLTEVYDPAAGTGYDICDHCGWEDDGTSTDERHSSINRGSMAEYRERMMRESNYHDCRKWPVS